MTLHQGRKREPPKGAKPQPILQQSPDATPEAVAKALLRRVKPYDKPLPKK